MILLKNMKKTLRNTKIQAYGKSTKMTASINGKDTSAAQPETSR